MFHIYSEVYKLSERTNRPHRELQCVTYSTQGRTDWFVTFLGPHLMHHRQTMSCDLGWSKKGQSCSVYLSLYDMFRVVFFIQLSFFFPLNSTIDLSGSWRKRGFDLWSYNISTCFMLFFLSYVLRTLLVFQLVTKTEGYYQKRLSAHVPVFCATMMLQCGVSCCYTLQFDVLSCWNNKPAQHSVILEQQQQDS